MVIKKKKREREFHGNPVVRTPRFGAQVRSLLGELRSHKPSGPTKKKKKKEDYTTKGILAEAASSGGGFCALQLR